MTVFVGNFSTELLNRNFGIARWCLETNSDLIKVHHLFHVIVTWDIDCLLLVIIRQFLHSTIYIMKVFYDWYILFASPTVVPLVCYCTMYILYIQSHDYTILLLQTFLTMGIYAFLNCGSQEKMLSLWERNKTKI